MWAVFHCAARQTSTSFFPTIPINLRDIINILLRGGPLEIMGAGVIIFHSTNIFFVQFVCMHFDFDVEALHDFFSTELLLILKACKASHSLIVVPLKVAFSLESRFSRNSSIAIIEKEMSY